MNKIKANPDAEIGVLGTLITDGDPNSLIVKKVMMLLNENHFYNLDNRDLFQIIKKMYQEKQSFDVVTLLGRPFDTRTTQIIEKVIINNRFSPRLLEVHIEELTRLSAMRRQLYIMNKTSVDCLREPISSLAADIMQKGIKEAGNANLTAHKQGKTFFEIQKAHENNEYAQHSVVQCGIKQFEQIKNCSLITIAGASGVGKTFFSIYVMDEIARYQLNKQVLFFSLEMKCNEIWERYLYIRSTKDSNLLPKGKIFDQPRIDIDDIETISHLESIETQISVIVVDYLALVTSSKKSEREDLRLSDITQRLAALAMELNCIVICLSQVNREASKNKDDKCPYPHHVADSIGSVRSSSLWIGIDRPEDNPNLFVAKCRKSRYGNNFEAWFDFNQGRFSERNQPYYKAKNVSEKSFNEFIGDIN